jgi:hypothetical protein
MTSLSPGIQRQTCSKSRPVRENNLPMADSIQWEDCVNPCIAYDPASPLTGPMVDGTGIASAIHDAESPPPSISPSHKSDSTQFFYERNSD